MKIVFPPTLSGYFFRTYSLNFLILLASLLAIIYMFEMVELFRRAGQSEGIGLPLLLKMGLLKLPLVGQLIFPFAILFSAMWTFWQLTKRHELIIIRSAGLSVWQFILPMILTAFIIGLLKIILINPMSAMFITKYQALDSQYLEKKSRAISLSEQGLWLRQEYQGGNAILHAGKVSIPDWTLSDVTVFFFSPQNSFLRRIDAGSSYLKNGMWNFKYAVVNAPGKLPEVGDSIKIETDLDIQELENSFSGPETISFWKLPNYIRVMEETGLDSTPLKIYLQSLLAQPLLFMAMVLLAATVSMRLQRLRGATFLIFSGIVIGFIVFFMSSFLQALGASGQIPVFVAAWFPATISLLFGIGAMMVLEDG